MQIVLINSFIEQKMTLFDAIIINNESLWGRNVKQYAD